MSMTDTQVDYSPDAEMPGTASELDDFSKIQLDLAEFIKIVAAIRSTPKSGELRPTVDTEEGSG